jgi:hypothetical protein
LIRQAVLMADRAFVFDNSALGKPPQRLISFIDGHAKAVAPSLPEWATTLYAADIGHTDPP